MHPSASSVKKMIFPALLFMHHSITWFSENLGRILMMYRLYNVHVAYFDICSKGKYLKPEMRDSGKIRYSNSNRTQSNYGISDLVSYRT